MTDICVQLNQKGDSFVPFWKKCITAGRAAEGLREEWRTQLRELQREVGFEYIRFHGIFHDDMMIYNEYPDGTPYYNWQYMDELFDFLLGIGLKPMFELGFMPTKLATVPGTVFWWKANGCPPTDYNKWHDLVKETVRHCINRYGIAEVLDWYFEVWNEPNLGSFWHGTQEEYFKLYDYSVRAIKELDSRLRVGGPSSSGSDFRETDAELPYVEAFLQYCKERDLPVDFVAAHPYPTYWPLDEAGQELMGYMDSSSTFLHLTRIRNQIDASAYPQAEIHLTEWNSSPSPRDLIHDTAFMAPFIIYNNIKGIGLVDSLGFWDFTDIFEENGAGDALFHGGFGLINQQGIKKASYYAYWFLSKLGTEALSSGESYFISRDSSGRIQILLWNYCYYKDAFALGDRTELTLHERYSVFEGEEQQLHVELQDIQGNYKTITYRLGRDHGSALDVWLRNGATAAPTLEEIELLKQQARPEGRIGFVDMTGSYKQHFSLQPHDVVLLELIPQM